MTMQAKQNDWAKIINAKFNQLKVSPEYAGDAGLKAQAIAGEPCLVTIFDYHNQAEYWGGDVLAELQSMQPVDWDKPLGKKGMTDESGMVEDFWDAIERARSWRKFWQDQPGIPL